MPIAARLSAFTAWMTRHEKSLAAIAAIYVLLTITLQARKPLWFDEIFTFYIARAPGLQQLFQAVPADGNPPLNYLLTRLSLGLFGESELATRLPAILGFALAMLATYLFIRRRCSAVAALFGLVVLSTSVISGYADMARPYAPVLGFTGLALVGWQRAAEAGQPRGLALVVMAVGIAGAIASHHYGIFHVGLPLAVGEAARLTMRRRVDLPLWLAGIVGLSAVATTIPFALQTNRLMLVYTRTSANFWAKPSLASLRDYLEMASPRLVLTFIFLLCLSALFLRSTPVAAPVRDPLPVHEVAAAVSLALLLPVMVVVTWLAAGYYGSRYAITTTMGLSILLGFAADRLGGRAGHGIVAAALSLVLLVVGTAGSRAMAYVHGLLRPQLETKITFPTGEQPIVYCNSVRFLNTWKNAPPLRARLHYLADLPYALTQPDFLAEVSLVVNQPVVPAKVDDYQTFLRTHPTFLLYCGDDPLSWTKGRLLAAGWTLRPVEQIGVDTLFSAEAPRDSRSPRP
jgi:4-amino-4-deoxy-L-arabinose transferase-like glycosyltransferase